jgi:hypothetical protein
MTNEHQYNTQQRIRIIRERQDTMESAHQADINC